MQMPPSNNFSSKNRLLASMPQEDLQRFFTDPRRRRIRDDRLSSGGRRIAGFPVGTPMDTCFAYGQNPSMLRERYYEAHDLVMRAWTETDTFAFNGRFNQQRYVNIWPRPLQAPHPPVWIPGGGSVETWRWC